MCQDVCIEINEVVENISIEVRDFSVYNIISQDVGNSIVLGDDGLLFAPTSGGGGGSVESVNGISPDVNGNVVVPIPENTSDLTNDSGFITSGDIPTPITNHSELNLDDGTNPHGTTKNDVGLGNVDNTSDADKPISSATQGALNNKADLVAGKVPASQLPSYVDDVIEGYFNGTNFYTDALFTNLITPESGKIYLNIAVTPATQYRWSGSAYVQIGGGAKKSIEYNVTSLCLFNFPATSNWTYAGGFNGMGAYGSARIDSVYSNFLTLIASSAFIKVIGGIAPFDMKLTSNGSFVTPEANLIGGDLKLSVGYIEFNYSTGALSNATIVDAGTYTPATGGRVDLREDFGGEITIPKGAIWCYSWAHTKTSAVSGIYIQTILNFEEV